MESNPLVLSVLDLAGVKGKNITNISGEGLIPFLQFIISKKQDTKDAFYVLDVGEVMRLMDEWNHCFPNIRPFYAVKCNPDPALLAMLAMRGAGFDCASRAEIKAIRELGVSADCIIYANPCKAETHIKYAANIGVNLTTFDSLDEIKKIQSWHPKCATLLRIKAPNESTKYPLGSKYGALPKEVEPLLQAAHAAGLHIAGVAFHVGSMVDDVQTYRNAIRAAKEIFDTTIQLGCPHMHILDIGGGFTAGPQFQEAALTIKAALQEYFCDEPDLIVMAEPGRFLAETAFTLATNIIGKRRRGDLRQYWINDGIYGSMNGVLNGHTSVTATPLACKSNRANPTCEGERMFPSTVFGPTCDPLDMVFTNYQLPELEVDDWLVSPNMGAYTTCGGSNFNGFNISSISTYLVNSEHA